MTHELKRIIKAYQTAQITQTKCVLATVVHLEGSSYRRPGVRMLLLEDTQLVGAVSGGCVEKEIVRQATSVFKDGIAKVMTYDGRYRLGCEGVLYILLEPFHPSQDFLKAFENTIANRQEIELISYFDKKDFSHQSLGTVCVMNATSYPLQQGFVPITDTLQFHQRLQPCQRLVIIGAEHDAVKLVKIAAESGWEVVVVAESKEEKTVADFPGAMELLTEAPESLTMTIDTQTAVVIMTHSYAKDVRYLSALKHKKPAYLGLLGPVRRREKLFHELIETYPDISPEFLESVHGPAGLDVGAETPEEIAIAIMAEILAVIRKKKPILLKHKKGTIH